MLLDGFSISGYRSFGEKQQSFSKLSKINLVVGQNNSGKSNVLRLLVDHMHNYMRAINGFGWPPSNFSEIDKHLGTEKIPIKIGVAVNLDTDLAKRKLDESDGNIRHLIGKIFDSSFIHSNANLLWLVFGETDDKGKNGIDTAHIDQIKNENIMTPDEWNALCLGLTRGASDLDNNINSVLLTISRNLIETPSIYFIPAIRQINFNSDSGSDLSGAGIVEKLAKLQNPDHNEQELRKDFERVNHFLQDVVGNNDATIEIPYARDKIIVHMDGKALPLESLGTGIHEVIILASASTLLNDSIICIEEPEIHLHPILQKKLMQYLFNNTSNQYFIATHSPHLLDDKNSRIFHITNDGISSSVTVVKTNDELFDICSDLGYRPSDLLQTNCIIWVEGPSDRIYINHWLNSINSSLIEGTHYSIMFYGGRLLSHLTAKEYQVSDFISLTRLNRNSIIIIDSDKSNESDTINDTKARIKAEFESTNKMVWITQGREIENYIDPDFYEISVKSVHPSALELTGKTIYSNLPKYNSNNSTDVSTADKIKVAKLITKSEPDYDQLDLEERINEINRFICHANGFEI
ncbi:MAG: ATP-binding protein [Bacteroidetes bacterium]|nr:ATP-binding protein [Bacteroidota bacterium]